MTETTSMLAFIRDAGYLGLAVAFFICLHKRVLVLGWMYRDKDEAARYWRDAYMQLAEITGRSVAVAEKAVKS